MRAAGGQEPSAQGKAKSDALLLWVTTFVLGGAVLVFGGLLVYWNSDQVMGPVAVEGASLSPAENLGRARQHFVRGESRQALTEARVALALEQQKPSNPPLEKDIRRVLGQADLEQRDYVDAVEHFTWLQKHGGSADDLKSLSVARARLRKLNVDAVTELEGAQRLSTRGVQDQAYSQASRAVGRLQQNPGATPQVQAGHLVLANIALRQGKPLAALEQMREARKLGPLTAEQQALMGRLEAGEQNALASAPVVVPRLESSVAYPQGRPGRRAVKAPKATVSPEEVEGAEEPEAAAVAAPPRRAPRIELPKLQYPSGQNGAGSGIPGYQNNNRSNSLPGYNNNPGRTKDSLPGY
jgi:hypothetical protein